MRSVAIPLTPAGQRVERRQGIERRSIRGAFRLAASSTALRRRHGRRRQDQDRGFYTDHYDPPLLVSAMSVLLLSVLDSILTLQLLGRGARELNPLLAALIRFDVSLFTWTKTVLIAFVLLILVSHANHRAFGGMRLRSLMLVCVGAYVCLVSYQVTLMSLFAPLQLFVSAG